MDQSRANDQRTDHADRSVELNPTPFDYEQEEVKRGSVECRYVTGPAGTGKTYQFRQRIEADADEGILCATTGVAAVNLGTTTIHSTFGYFDTESLIDKYVEGRLVPRYIHLRRLGIRSVMIDEASMLDADALDIHVRAASDANARLEREGKQIKLELTGDFAQLPPVKGQWAFKSPAWINFEPNIVKLTKIYRQDSVEFLAALSEARKGNGNEAARLLKPLAQWTAALDLYFPGTTIVAKNDEVEKINGLRYGKLIGAERAYRSSRWGQQKGEWKLIPSALKLKEGALVMILANRKDEETKQMVYANGDTGNVITIGETSIWVQLKRDNSIVEVNTIERGFETKDEPDSVKWPNAYFDEKKKRWVSGGISYLPVRLAYAITVHKSQGLTLDHVQIDPRAHFFGSPNMAYVALSRIKSPNNLKIVGTMEMLARKIKVDADVKGWI